MSPPDIRSNTRWPHVIYTRPNAQLPNTQKVKWPAYTWSSSTEIWQHAQRSATLYPYTPILRQMFPSCRYGTNPRRIVSGASSQNAKLASPTRDYIPTSRPCIVNERCTSYLPLSFTSCVPGFPPTVIILNNTPYISIFPTSIFTYFYYHIIFIRNTCLLYNIL